MNIDKQYELYKEKVIDKEELKKSILEYSYKTVTRDKIIEAGDFIMEMIPKVDQITEEYKPELSGFKNYLNRHIKWLSLQCTKKYVKEKDKSDAYQYHNKAQYKENLIMQETIPEYSISKEMSIFLKLKDGVISNPSMKRRITILALKNARLLNDNIIHNLSEILGVTPKWLTDKKEELINVCQKRLKSREYLMVRCNRLFIDITKDQDKLNKELDKSKKREILTKLEEKKNRLHKLQETLTKRSYGPRNEEIAKLLKIPKGTVDSSLFYIKKMLKDINGKNM